MKLISVRPAKRASACIAAVLFLATATLPASGDITKSNSRRSQTSSASRPVAIVTINLEEGFNFGNDLRDMSEVNLFVARLLKALKRDPDVLLLQEVNSKSAHRVARLLTRKTGKTFRVAQDAGRRAWWQTKSRVYKADTAVIINSKTMKEIGSSGYIVTTYDPPAGKVEYKKNARALVRQRDGGLELALASVHIPGAGPYTKRVQKVAKELATKYGPATSQRFHVIGGDFNRVGVLSGKSFGQIKTEKWWIWLTGGARNYNDSIYNVTRSKGVDYLFVKGGVLGAGVDGSKVAYSDHRFRWSFVGPDESAPSTPTDVRAGSINNGERVRISWTASSDAEAGIYEYDLWRSKDGAKFVRLGATANDVYYDESVAKGTEYWYYVVAKDWSGNRSVPSEIVRQVAGS
jgi:hypothetical protein